MKILLSPTSEIRGCVKFYHKGFEISVTNKTTFPELEIYGGKDFKTRYNVDILNEISIRGDAEGIKRAVEGIDAYLIR